MHAPILLENHPDKGLAFQVLTMALFSQFGTALIPYTEVAKQLMNWKTEKTAKARLNQLIQDGLVVVRFKFGVATTFVLVHDLANFILANRIVSISSTQKPQSAD